MYLFINIYTRTALCVVFRPGTFSNLNFKNKNPYVHLLTQS